MKTEMGKASSDITAEGYHIPIGTDLLTLLESLNQGGAMIHARVASLLFAEFQRTSDLDQKRLLGAEIFCKLMQAIEDHGAFCLFCLSGRTADIAAYFAVRTREIKNFYGECRTGLTDEKISTIYGVQTVDELIMLGHVPKSQGGIYNAKIIDFIQRVRKSLAKHGRLFAEYDEKENRFIHSDLLNMYFNAKHGVRVYLPGAVGMEKSIRLQDNQVGILINVEKRTEQDGDRNHIEVGTFDFAAVENMVRYAKNICEDLRALVRLRIEMRNDPCYFFKLLRDGTEFYGTVAGIKHIGRNDPCPCGSNIKYKKCHGR